MDMKFEGLYSESASLGYDLERKGCLVLAFGGLRMAEPKKKKAFKFMNLKALASD